jgi:hypothetical protein
MLTNINDPHLFSFQLEQRDVAASQTLRAALCKAEASHPGVSYDLVIISPRYVAGLPDGTFIF